MAGLFATIPDLAVDDARAGWGRYLAILREYVDVVFTVRTYWDTRPC